MAVRIRMKRLGRKHRPFFRICAMDQRTARGGKVLEELGTYDPMVPDTDARAVFNTERVDYWLSVGALPSDNVRVLIKKYGTGGTHLDQQKAALDRLAQPRVVPPPGEPAFRQKPAEAAAEPATETAAETAAPEPEAAAEPAPEQPAAEAEQPQPEEKQPEQAE